MNWEFYLTKVQSIELLWKNLTVYHLMQFLLIKQDWLQQVIWQSNITECIRCIMNISYYELHCEVIVIEKFCMKSHIWQHLNDSWLIDKVHYVYILQEDSDDISIDIHHIIEIN